MENYSLSDLRAAVDGGNDGWGNGGGAWWIIILFLGSPPRGRGKVERGACV